MNKTLHFVRHRVRNSQDPFCDPIADIKYVFQQMFKEIPQVYLHIFKDEEKSDLLKAYFKVFVTRLEEDPASLDKQLAAFYAAFLEAFNKKELAWLKEYVFHYCLATFALHMRRDAAVDAHNRNSFRASSALLSIRPYLAEGTFNEVKTELAQAGSGKEIEAPAPDVTVDALCVEDSEETVRNIKELAAHQMSPGSSWEEAAAACDEYAMSAKDGDPKAVPTALAYPDYKTPYFEVSDESGGSTGKV